MFQPLWPIRDGGAPSDQENRATASRHASMSLGKSSLVREKVYSASGRAKIWAPWCREHSHIAVFSIVVEMNGELHV